VGRSRRRAVSIAVVDLLVTPRSFRQADTEMSTSVLAGQCSVENTG